MNLASASILGVGSLLVVCLAGCPGDANPYGSGVGNGAGNGNGGNSSTGCGRCAVTGGGSTGAGSTSTSGSTGGTGVDCALVTAPSGGNCPSNQVLFFAQALDLCATVSAPNKTHVPLGGATFGVEGCSTTTVSDSVTGIFSLCVPANTPVSTSFAKVNYVSGDLAEVNVTENGGYLGSRGGIYLACSGALLAEQNKVQGFDTAKGAVLAVLISYGNQYPCGKDDAGMGDLSGWAVSPSYLDGDAGPWPVTYLSASITSVMSGVTQPPGYALIYNIDVPEIGLSISRPMDDGGIVSQQCHPIGSQYGFSGRVRAPAMGFSYAPILLP